MAERSIPIGQPDAPVVRGPQQERQRQRLLVAAGQTFVTLGYATATVADILKTAGMSRRSFYELFTSKEDALLALVDGLVGALRKEFEALTNGVDDPLEIAILMAISYLRVGAQFPMLPAQVIAAGGEPRDRQRYHFAELTGRFEQQLKRAHERGLIQRMPDRTMVRIFIGGLDHLIIAQHLDSGSRDAVDGSEAQVRELFIRLFT